MYRWGSRNSQIRQVTVRIYQRDHNPFEDGIRPSPTCTVNKQKHRSILDSGQTSSKTLSQPRERVRHHRPHHRYLLTSTLQIQPQVFRGVLPITNPAYILTTSSHPLQSLPTDSGQTTADHMSMPAIPGGTFLIHVAQEPRRPGIADAFEWDLWGRSLSNSTPTLAQRGKIPMLPRGAITV
jgi:hypothetical protein